MDWGADLAWQLHRSVSCADNAGAFACRPAELPVDRRSIRLNESITINQVNPTAANDTATAAGATDFTRPDMKYDSDNCLFYTGWNQGGLKTLELTNPDYNPCMRKSTSSGVVYTDSVGGKGDNTGSVRAVRGGS